MVLISFNKIKMNEELIGWIVGVLMLMLLRFALGLFVQWRISKSDLRDMTESRDGWRAQAKEAVQAYSDFVYELKKLK